MANKDALMSEYRRVRHNVQQNIRRLGQRGYDTSEVSIPSFISKNATPSQIQKETKRLQKISDTRYKKTTKTVTVTTVNKRTGKVTEEQKTVTGTKARKYEQKERSKKAYETRKYNQERERIAVENIGRNLNIGDTTGDTSDDYKTDTTRELYEPTIEPIDHIPLGASERDLYPKPHMVERTDRTMDFQNTSRHLMNIAIKNVRAYILFQGNTRKKRNNELTKRALLVTRNAEQIIEFLESLSPDDPRFGLIADSMMESDSVRPVEWFYEENGASNFIADFNSLLSGFPGVGEIVGTVDESDEGFSYTKY